MSIDNEVPFFEIVGERTEYPPGNLYFQFNDDEPVLFSENISGEFAMTITPSTTEQSISFDDGKGKSFRIFIKPISPHDPI